MTRDTKEWNFDRIYSAQAQIHDVLNDMSRCLYSGKVNDVVKERMLQRLEMAKDQIEKLQVQNA